MPAIETEGLTKYYGSIRGVKDLNLQIEEGEIFGYLGPNGAGKTTTIRLFLNFIFPTKGKATLLGKDIVKESKNIRESVGYIPGEVSLYEGMTGEELVNYFAGIRGKEPSRLGELKKRFDFNLKAKIRELSHGNRQKLAVLLAFSFDPPLYLLDEPTSGLDPLMQREFYALLKEEKANGKTVFFSSHVLPEVEKVCDRVGILKEGNLVAIERVDDLKKKKIRYVTVSLTEEVSPDAFAQAGVEVIPQGNHELKIIVRGAIDPILKRLANYHVDEVTISHASLEEVFLEYYE